jgi:hypothetical protein
MDPYSKVDYSLIAPEASMAMKKTSGGKHGDEEDLRWQFPSLAGCREELLDPPDLRVDGGGGSHVFWKSDRVFRFFLSGVFIGKGAASGVG